MQNVNNLPSMARLLMLAFVAVGILLGFTVQVPLGVRIALLAAAIGAFAWSRFSRPSA